MQRSPAALTQRVAPCLLLAATAIAVGCGPSFQALYEGDARFEHCYALEEDGIVSIQKRADCWRDWTDHYTYAQTRDRVQYASMRYRALTSSNLPTDEGMMSAAPGEANPQGTATTVAPTNAFAPPATTASATPGSTPRSKWMTAPESTSSAGAGGSWMSTAPQNMLPDPSDAGTKLVAPANGQQPETGPVPSNSAKNPTSPAPKKMPKK
ncbi:MAG: hypothetical protein ABI461_24290 [Polyangiaceae bacterium]